MSSTFDYEMTMESYQQLQSWLCRATKMRVQHKSTSLIMRVAAERFVRQFAGIDPKRFMEDFCTTIPVPFIGTVAFLTWDPYGPWEDGVTLGNRIPTLVHEAVHARQIANVGGKQFAADYLLDPAWRCHLEVEAYLVTIALYACLNPETGALQLPEKPWRRCTVLDEAWRGRARQAAEASIRALANYSLPAEMLEKAAVTLRREAETPTAIWWSQPLLGDLAYWAAGEG